MRISDWSSDVCSSDLETYADPRQRQLFKNIMYVGALSALLDIDPAVIEALLLEQYKGKEKLVEANKHALHLGRDYAIATLTHQLGLRGQRDDTRKSVVEGKREEVRVDIGSGRRI